MKGIITSTHHLTPKISSIVMHKGWRRQRERLEPGTWTKPALEADMVYARDSLFARLDEHTRLGVTDGARQNTHDLHIAL